MQPDKLDMPFATTVSREQAAQDPMLFALVMASQPSTDKAASNHDNDLRSICLQQVAVGWAIEGKHTEARWAFQKGIEYARRTRQKSKSRLRGLAESCLKAGCPKEAVEAARYLRVEDRCRFLAQAACILADKNRDSEAITLLEEAESRLERHLQTGGSVKPRAYRAIGLAYFKLGNLPAFETTLKKGILTDADWPPAVKIRNHLEVADAYLASNQTESALKHARTAATLARRHRNDEMLVLTAVVLSETGDQELAEEILREVDGRHHTSEAAQGFARLGQTEKALDLLAKTREKSRAEAIYITCSYLDGKQAKKRIVELTEDLKTGQRDWQLLQSVGELCAKAGDKENAYRYYTASLKTYQRDWPELWGDPRQKAFVVANFGRELAEAELAHLSEAREHGPYGKLLNSLEWPQEIEL